MLGQEEFRPPIRMAEEAWVLDFLRNRNYIGLDIGHHAVKAVQISRKGDRLILENLAIQDLPPELQEETETETKQEILAQTLGDFLKKNNFKTKNVITAVSGDSAIVRYVKLPFVSEEELKNVIAYEAEQYIPLSIDQVVLDFEVLGELEEENQKKLEVLLVAAKTEIIEQHLQMLKEVGLKPAVIDVDAFALQNAFEWNFGKPTGETIALLHLGAKLTTLNILEDGITHLTRDVAVAGNHFTREIQREFGNTFTEADEMKCREGEVLVESEDILQMTVPNKENPASRIGEAITPVLNKLIAEIQRSFDYYESSVRQKPISRVLISGGSARMKNLDKFLAQKLNLAVEFNDPFKQVEIPENKFDRDFISLHGPQFAVGLGLALRQAE